MASVAIGVRGSALGIALLAVPSIARAAPCDGDFGTGTTNACPTSASPYCDVGGTCRTCTGNGDCASRPARPICNVSTGACGVECFSDVDCAAGHFCPVSGQPCIAKLPNGGAIPSAMGACSVANGFRACISGVCESDQLCGLKKGTACTSDAQCRIGVCFAADRKCGVPDGEACADPSQCRSGHCNAGRCTACSRDADCGGLDSGKVCAETTFACTDGCRGTIGNHCPAGLQCTSSDTSIGACVRFDAGADASSDGAATADAGDGGADGASSEDAGAELAWDRGTMGGNGLDCRSARAGAGGGAAVLLAFGAVLAGLVRRLRR